MAKNRAWEAYPLTYRAREMKTLAGWIAAGESCSVVGLSGCGRSTLLNFLGHRPDALQTYLPPNFGPVAVIPVDLNNLPTSHIATLYRTILHAFYWVRHRFDAPLQQAVTDLYLENRAVQDPFLSQRVLYDLLLLFQERQIQVVLILNRFDRFCQTAPPQVINTLRGLRDSFKDTLCYIAGMVREVIYLSDPAALGDMYELLDSHICWVGAMSEMDAQQMLDSLFHNGSCTPTEAEREAMLALSGRFPVLLKAIAHWWQLTDQRPPAIAGWPAALLAERSIQFRLDRIWHRLTQEEQLALVEVEKLQGQGKTYGEVETPDRTKEGRPTTARSQHSILHRLAVKGLCEQADRGWKINGQLLTTYVASLAEQVRGKIWIEEKTRTAYQGQAPIEGLTPLQYDILRFFVSYPHTKHTRDDIIDNAWPEDERREGITPNALQAHIASMRKKIEPNPAQPCYLVTWHGRPGGYQFFPEGRPG